jgi:tetratricopeptide (TPR) repeat protein
LKGEENLWLILQDKLETLLAGGRLAEASRVAETALKLANRIFPENHPSLSLSYERMGLIRHRATEESVAKVCFSRALRIVEANESPDQRAIYRLARRLAGLCDGTGQEEEAIGYYEKAIEAGSQLDDAPHSDLGVLLNNAALIHRRSGRQNAAEQYYLRALALYERQLGPEHPDVATVLNNLGVFYTGEERFDEAEQMHRRALSIRRQAHPRSHPDIAQSNCNLAVVYHARGDLKRAGELYQESLQEWEGVEKPSADYEIVASNYADLLRSLGKRRQAGVVESRARKKRARP